jgi:hypothetical protein
MPNPCLPGLAGQDGGAMSAEWEIIKNLFETRHRLKQSLKYQSLEIEEVSESDLERTNAVEFVESSLRSIFGDANLEELVRDEMASNDPKIQAQFKIHSKKLCTLLDGMVNLDQISDAELEKARQDHQLSQETTSSYKNLAPATYVLRSSNEDYNFVSGQGFSIFRLISESVAIHAQSVIGAVSDFFHSRDRPTLDELPSPPVIETAVQLPEGPEVKHWHLPALKGLFSLLSSREKGASEQQPESGRKESKREQQDCASDDNGHKHTVLVKLPDLSTSDSYENQLSPALNMLLSYCDSPSTSEVLSELQECICMSHSTV